LDETDTMYLGEQDEGLVGHIYLGSDENRHTGRLQVARITPRVNLMLNIRPLNGKEVVKGGSHQGHTCTKFSLSYENPFAMC